MGKQLKALNGNTYNTNNNNYIENKTIEVQSWQQICTKCKQVLIRHNEEIISIIMYVQLI